MQGLAVLCPMTMVQWNCIHQIPIQFPKIQSLKIQPMQALESFLSMWVETFGAKMMI